ncbi:MAG: metallophosphoesterase family protein [Anaerolineae bacterium]|nr:metallophosphoesterase family protein [Anaerolineae bacterium]
MTTFLAFPDIHDRAEPLKKMRHIIADVDAVLLAGDMTNGKPDNLQRVLNIIEAMNENIFAVCGNMDSEAMNMRLARDGISVHRRHVMLDGLAILGCGGALPYYGKYVFSEDELAGFLNDSLQGVSDNTPKILICHQPPYDTKVDRVEDGTPVGSKAVREFIERVQPLICFSGHIHGATGIDSIGNTQLINPGPLWQTSQYAYAEVENGEVVTLEIRQGEKLEI